MHVEQEKNEMFANKYGPWAVVVGASEGIGAAFAKELASRGENVVLIARTAANLALVAEEIRGEHPSVSVQTLSVDLGETDAVQVIADATAELEVGCLVYNVGSEPEYGMFLDHDWSLIDNRLQRNFVVKAALIHHFGRLMRERSRGAMVLMGSVSGFNGSPGYAMYAASKAYTLMLSEGLWWEFKSAGIDVICPVVGPTVTPTMIKAGVQLDSAGRPEDVARKALDHIKEGPVWIDELVRERIAKTIVTPPAERATLAAERAAVFNGVAIP